MLLLSISTARATLKIDVKKKYELQGLTRVHWGTSGLTKNCCAHWGLTFSEQTCAPHNVWGSKELTGAHKKKLNQLHTSLKFYLNFFPSFQKKKRCYSKNLSSFGFKNSDFVFLITAPCHGTFTQCTQAIFNFLTFRRKEIVIKFRENSFRADFIAVERLRQFKMFDAKRTSLGINKERRKGLLPCFTMKAVFKMPPASHFLTNIFYSIFLRYLDYASFSW